jgi:hypothetical protein
LTSEQNRFGEFLIQVKERGIIVHEEVVKNRIMNAILNEEINILTGAPTDIEIKYVAFGTGTTPVTNTDTQLANEPASARFIPSIAPHLTATGEVRTEFTILETEAQIVIEELGIFAGSSATSAPNSGKLLARVLWHFDKTANVELSITRIDRIIRG